MYPQIPLVSSSPPILNSPLISTISGLSHLTYPNPEPTSHPTPLSLTMYTLEFDFGAFSDWRVSSISVSGFDNDSGKSMDAVKGEYFGKGVVRLFRTTNGLTSNETSLRPISTETTPIDSRDPDDHFDTNVTPSPSLIVAILAVPSYMTASDFLGFISLHSCEKDISHIRVIRSSREVNRNMVLLKFRMVERAQDFVDKYSGKVFNSMDPETCLCVFIHDISVVGNVVGDKASVVGADNFPYLLLDPFTNGFSKGKPLPPPTPDLRELPTCPVCLERMDSEITGLATILCEHTFHCHCLSKWAGGNCPVCRYSGKKSGTNSTSDTSPGVCTTCSGTENTWICLICGNIGCGRYTLGHAHSHFDQTGHGYAMEMSTQRVWDYVSDGYVHRLIQSDVGKLVELDESSSSSSKFVYSDDGKKSGDVEQLALEYTALLTSQLDSQREYYEGLFADSARKVEEMRLLVERQHKENDQKLVLEKQKEKEISEKQQGDVVLENERLKNELSKAQKESDKLSLLSKTFRQSLQDEKAISGAMMAKVKKLQGDKEAKETQIRDLEEQLRDVMFFLEARDKLKDADEDVKEGTLVMKKKKGRK